MFRNISCWVSDREVEDDILYFTIFRPIIVICNKSYLWKVVINQCIATTRFLRDSDQRIMQFIPSVKWAQIRDTLYLFIPFQKLLHLSCLYFSFPMPSTLWHLSLCQNPHPPYANNAVCPSFSLLLRAGGSVCCLYFFPLSMVLILPLCQEFWIFPRFLPTLPSFPSISILGVLHVRI